MNNGNNRNYSQNQSYDSNRETIYPGAYDETRRTLYDRPEKREASVYRERSNTPLVILTLCISVIAVILCVVLILLFVNEEKGESNSTPVTEEPTKTETVTETPAETPAEMPKEVPAETPKTEKKTTTTVERKMYVSVDDFLVLRSGPGTNYSKITNMYNGEEVYVLEYVSSSFAKVRYNGLVGYAGRAYLSESKPQPQYQWNYSNYEVENAVTQSLYWYVNAVTTGNTSGAENHFAGSILQTEINNAKNMAAKVDSEELINVSYHSHTRLSPSKVSVTRHSNIKIVEKNGSSRIATEERVYVLQNTGSGIYIIDIHK